MQYLIRIWIFTTYHLKIMQIESINPTLQSNKTTYLSQACTAGITQVQVDDNTNVTANEYYVIERMGTVQAEEVQVTSISGSGIVNITATKFPHSVGAQFVNCPSNIMNIFRSTSGATVASDPSFNLLVQLTRNWGDTQTDYFDSNGLQNYSYFTQDYNTTTANVISQSNIITGAGYDFASLYMLTNRARLIIKDMDYSFISKAEMAMYANEEYGEYQKLADQIDRNYSVVVPSSGIAFNTGTYEYPLPSNCKFPIYVLISRDNITWVRATPKSMKEVYDIMFTSPSINGLASSLTDGIYYLNGSNIGIWPIPPSGYFKVLYYPTVILLSKDTDTPYIPINDYSTQIVDGIVLRVIEKKGKNDLERAAYWSEKVEKNHQKFMAQLQERQKQMPPTIRPVDNDQAAPLSMDQANTSYS